jgi:hypothetical protein
MAATFATLSISCLSPVVDYEENLFGRFDRNAPETFTGLKKTVSGRENGKIAPPYPVPLSRLSTPNPVFPFFHLFPSISRPKSRRETCGISMSRHKNLI